MNPCYGEYTTIMSNAATRRSAGIMPDTGRLRPLFVALLVVFIAVLIWSLAVDRSGTAFVQKRIIACPTTGGLNAVTKTALTGGGLLELFAVSASHKCTIIAKGTKVIISGRGGFVWWRVRVVHEGRKYWLNGSAL